MLQQSLVQTKKIQKHVPGKGKKWGVKGLVNSLLYLYLKVLIY